MGQEAAEVEVENAETVNVEAPEAPDAPAETPAEGGESEGGESEAEGPAVEPAGE